MSTKRNILLAASALAAVAVSPAFAAKSIVPGNVDGPTGNAVETSNYFLAKQVDFTLNPGPSAGFAEFKLVPTVGATFPTGNTVVTLDVAGGTFNAPADSTWALTGGGTCNNGGTTIAISGTPTPTQVKFVISGMNDCDGTSAADQLGFRIPIKVAGPTAPFTVDLSFTTDVGVPIDGPANTGPTNIVQIADAVDLDIFSNTGVASTAIVGDQFRSMTSNPATLGSLDLDFTTDVGGFTVYKNLSNTAVATGDIAGSSFVVTPTVAGFTGLGNLSLGGATTTSLSGSSATVVLTQAQTLSILSPSNLTIADPTGVGAGGAIAAQDFTATGTVSFTSGSGLLGPQTLTAPGTTTPFALAEIVRDGTTVYIPWVASGTLAVVSTSNNILRVGNQGSTAVVVRGVILTSSVLPASSLPTAQFAIGTAPARGELVINSAQLQAAFGSDFGRADIQLVIEAPSSDISVRKMVARPDGSFEGSVSTDATLNDGSPTR